MITGNRFLNCTRSDDHHNRHVNCQH